MALVDCTVFNSGKDALVFGTSGSWYHYPFDTSELAFQAWESVGEGPVEATGKHECRIGTIEYHWVDRWSMSPDYACWWPSSRYCSDLSLIHRASGHLESSR